MKPAIIYTIVRKDLALGPRSPMILFGVVMPLVMTMVVRLIFGSLGTDDARMALVYEDGSALAETLMGLPGLRTTRLESASALEAGVLAFDFDGGVVIPPGFEAAMRDGSQPRLGLSLSGESAASDRLFVVLGLLQAARRFEGRPPPVELVVERLEEPDPIPMATRLVPMLAFFSFAVAGLYVPATLLVEEKERRTLSAILATPASLGDVVIAKAVLGIVLSLSIVAVTLALNDVRVESPAALAAAILVGAVFWSLLGVTVGLAARSAEMLFAVVKGAGTLLFLPTVFYLFPEWPRWIAMLFPTFWVIDPLWRVVAEGATLADVAILLVLTLACCLAALPALRALTRRAAARLA